MGTHAGVYMPPSWHGGVVHHPKLIYHGLIRSAWEHIDAAAGGSFFALSIEKAHKLIEKMASNQSWDEEHTQTRTRKVRQLDEVDKFTAKIDLHMKKLENPGLDHLKMVDARVACEECREIGHMGINCPTVSQDVNFIGNFNNSFHSNQGFNVGWNKCNFPFNNRQQGGMGQNFNKSEPSFKDIVWDHQLRINLEVGKKLLANDRILESINSKMNNFTMAVHNQLNFKSVGDADSTVGCSNAISKWRRFPWSTSYQCQGKGEGCDYSIREDNG
jgi:hypothetical protein